MACVEAFVIYTAKGDPLIYRLYRDNVDLPVISELFRTRVLHSQGQAATSAPIRMFGSQTLTYLSHNDVHLVAVVKNNANVMMTMNWLSSLIRLFEAYFKKVKQKNIKANFVLIYELLDEVCDDGIPQITDPATLKSYIFQKGQLFREDKVPTKNVTLQVTGQVAHRNPNAKHKKNEVFLDVVEQVNLLMSHDGTILKADVTGRIMMKPFLSGMPECRLGLNDQGEDCMFHTLVNMKDWDKEKVVSFVPPDTEFEVMKYRCSDNIQIPFKVMSNVVEHGRTRLTIDMTVRALFEGALTASAVLVRIPVPPQTAKASLTVSKGKAKYDAKEGAIVWKINKYSGLKEQSLSAEVSMVSTTREKKAWNRPPVSMEFTVPMFGASPLRVQYLKVWERSGYKVEKWVRKVCKSGDYVFRQR